MYVCVCVSVLVYVLVRASDRFRFSSASSWRCVGHNEPGAKCYGIKCGVAGAVVQGLLQLAMAGVLW